MTEYEEINEKVIYKNAKATDFQEIETKEVKEIIETGKGYPIDTGLSMWQCHVSKAIFPVKAHSIRGYSYNLYGQRNVYL